MKSFHTALGAAFVAVTLAACSPPAAQDTALSAPAATESVHAKSKGEVIVLQPEYNAVTIRHEAIPEYGMGAMTMEFTTADPAQLNGVSVGDQVTFELKAPTEIEKIEVVKK
ncbi:MAG: copper-binding protein [Hyphomonadaceae bacterium]|nr:copper-binding protein [Hyphomonadaceae bacterium]